jgi:hypothetical protein
MDRSVAFASGSATVETPIVVKTETEATMRRIPRSQWIEWLDSLAPSTKVAVVSDEDHRPANGGWTFRSADYDPFDDVVEIVLDDERGRLRVLLESPSEILAVGPDGDPEHITILSADGPLVITRALSDVPARPPAKRHRKRLLPT